MALTVIVAVLAGGQSRRMGSDKAALRRDGVTLLGRTASLAVEAGCDCLIIGRVSATEDVPSGVTCLADDPDCQGPAAGVLTALRAAAGRAVVALPCDLPALSLPALHWLVTTWAAHPQASALGWRDGDHLAPLPGCYSPDARQALSSHGGSLQAALRASTAIIVEVPTAVLRAFRDTDTPDDWSAFGSDLA